LRRQYGVCKRRKAFIQAKIKTGGGTLFSTPNLGKDAGDGEFEREEQMTQANGGKSKVRWQRNDNEINNK
jgi:hypothetical protein